MSETIEILKVMLREKEYHLEDVQELFFVGYNLKDDQRILDYGIPGNFTIDLVHQESCLILHFKMPSNETTFDLEVQKCDNIPIIKSIIQDRANLPISSLVETPTKDVIEVEVRWMHTVVDVKIIIESMIDIPIQCMELLIGRTQEQLQDGKTFASYDMDQFDFLTIKIPDKFQISVRTRTSDTITLEGQYNEDTMTLASYSIEKESLLFLKMTGKRVV
ncbi:hypothetical protein JRO89_XS03G0090000 [Xanthoceras sorbifolium]|uniref:Ubiquitin-like domain-containing protein n=1 Tax=Xanthoceras sorbifolium TaxID=99658 RepID=A0ABQ8I987_9ROSI|nr:hypothetical protein JRO89_XS03G0090000 [Xanthoceras sorbifolium]